MKTHSIPIIESLEVLEERPKIDPFKLKKGKKKPSIDTSTSELLQKKAAQLYILIEDRKRKEKEETQLKDFFKQHYPNGLVVGEYIITNKKCTRTNLDKKQLSLDLGDKLKEYESISEYTQLEVLKAE